MATQSMFGAAAISAAVLALSVTGGAAVAATPDYSKIVAFGDSLTDTGNLLVLTTILNGIAPDLVPVPLPQASDYFNGRFSNGRVAVEVLADGLKGALNDGQSLALENFAFGGATTGLDGRLPGTGLVSQVGTFNTGLNGAAADANALYFVWAGANDLRGLLDPQADAGAVVGGALTNLSNVVLTLYGLGARQFLLPNLPDIGLTPEALALGTDAAAGASFASQLFNGLLGNVYGQLAQALPDAKLITFDTLAAHRALTAVAAGSGLFNVDTACFSGDVGVAGVQCATPGNHLYWDKIHPTAFTHEVLGAQILAAVPEPTTLVMMGAGVLMLLALGRRRSV